MAEFYPDAWLDELRAKCDIVQVVSQYVNLTQKGRKYWGLCPFHGEKTASFSVDQDKQFYYCFGCHQGGNVIHFIMNIEKMSFPEAVQFLAEKVGMEPPKRKDAEKLQRAHAQKQRLYDALKETAKFYHDCLYAPIGQRAREYLTRREIAQNTVTRFGMGYSPAGWDVLYQHLKEKGFSDDDVIKAGLATQKNGKCFDFFRDRLMFPIIDQYARVVGFGGRILEGDGPKYINSTQTLVYNKREMLYGLNEAKKFEAKREMVIVEGYMDLIAVRTAGVQNVLASLGTALTAEQVRLLRRFADKLYICYDGDAAGRHAALRGLDIAQDQGMDVRVVMLPDGKDPDDVVKKQGPKALRECIQHSLTLTEFKLDLLKQDYDLADPNGRTEYAKKAAALAGKCEPVERERYYRRIAQDTGFAYETIVQQGKGSTGNDKENMILSKRNNKAGAEKEDNAVKRAENMLIAMMANDIQDARTAFQFVGAMDFSTPINQQLARNIEAGLQRGEVSPSALIQQMDDTNMANEAMAVLNTDLSALNPSTALMEVVIRVLIFSKERQADQLLRQAEGANGDQKKEIVRKIGKYNEQIRKLKRGTIPAKGDME